MPLPIDLYTRNIQTYSSQLASLKKRSALVSLLRLGAFLCVLLFAYLAIVGYNTAFSVAAGVAVIVFVWLIRKSVSITERKRLVEELLFLNRNELAVLGGSLNRFDDGSKFTGRSMHAIDLDIFGEHSVYHMLNRTATSHGSTQLCEMLNTPSTAANDILPLQKAVQSLAPQTKLRQLIAAKGRLFKDESTVEDIERWLNTDNEMLGKRWLQVARFLLPAAAIIALFYALDTNNTGPLSLLVLLNWAIVGIYFRYVTKQHLLAGKKEPVLRQYASILSQFMDADVAGAPMLEDLQKVSSEGHREIFRLSRRTSILDQRMNFLINILGNSLLQYDIHCMLSLEKWKENNRHRFNKWINAVGKIEQVNSLATFAFNNPGYCYPNIHGEKPFLEATSLGHPLIPAQEQVTSNITIGENEKLLIVTGSNMSGKSTFLRTVGVNVLLAQCGAPVCASSFSWSPMNILSSIRISDSLQESTSYFMAELKRLHQVIAELESGKAALVLIDEVLRGTNSDDKRHGSEALILKLLNYNCLALFATHDLSLSELEVSHPAKVANYCFESVIKDNELSFDYKLRRGVATNKNASFLMAKMGII
jgi:DNA mismatch repair ATPase MutS